MKTHLKIDKLQNEIGSLAKKLNEIRKVRRDFHGYQNCKDALNLVLEELNELARSMTNEQEK
jgi:hypothetical protein